MLKLNLSNLCHSLRTPARELLHILKAVDCDEGIIINATKTEEKGLSVKFANNTADITYSEPSFFFRALSFIPELSAKGCGEIHEVPNHKSLGPMLDCSRNAVLTVDSIKKMVRHISLMGHNMIMLYTEDTYTLDKYPYFGYMRGRYTHDEIKELDKYCLSFGIELVPCIQTLAHLGEFLKYPCNNDIRDISDILLVDEPKTYEFIEECIRTCSENFTTKRIHLGMDEAWMLGEGAYKRRNGIKRKADIMRSHLKKVCDICDKYGVAPTIWSDMFFSVDADGNPRDRYCFDASLPADIYTVPPKNLTLMYWDYYNGDKRIYDGVIEMHQKFDNPVSFAGGAWKWVGYAPLNHYSFTRSKPAIQSCFEHKVDDILITAWGDNGGECPAFAIMPTFQLYAEGSFAGCLDNERVAERFKTCTGGIMEDFMMLDMPNMPRKNFDEPNDNNPAKYLVYYEPFMGLADKHIGENYSETYAEFAQYLEGAAERNPEWSYIFKTSAALCKHLSDKTYLTPALKAAYDIGDKDSLEKLLEKTKETLASLDAFYECVVTQWYTENKTFGFEPLDLRLGGLHNRFSSMIRRLSAYLDGSISELPELTQERLRLDSNYTNPNLDIHSNGWGFVASTSVL